MHLILCYSDGKIEYVWNKESIFITISMPFDRQSSRERRVPKTIRAPPLVMESPDLNIPFQEYKIPQFTIPSSYTLGNFVSQFWDKFQLIKYSADFHSNNFSCLSLSTFQVLTLPAFAVIQKRSLFMKISDPSCQVHYKYLSPPSLTSDGNLN